MRTDNLTISVVGKAQDVAAGLAAFGAQQSTSMQKVSLLMLTFLFMPEGVTLETVFSNYYEAMGGVEALKGLALSI